MSDFFPFLDKIKYLPSSLRILGKLYQIEYFDSINEVDENRRESLMGQINYWERKIRVFRGKRTIDDILETILHETLHGIIYSLRLSSLEEDHDDLSVLSVALYDTLERNGWLNLK